MQRPSKAAGALQKVFHWVHARRPIPALCACTLRRHPTFYPGGNNGHCVRNSLDPAPCDSRRLYLHQICGDNRWHTKSHRWDNLTLWFIDDTPQMRPLYADGGGPKGPHPFMPCADKVAWVDLEDQVKENP